MAKPGMDTTTVQRGHSGATGAEATCAVPGTFMVEGAKVTPDAFAPARAEAVAEASQAKQLEMAGSGAVATAQAAEAVGDDETKHATPHATAGAKTVPHAVVPAQAEAATEASQTRQLEMAMSDAVAPTQAGAGGSAEARQ